MKSRDFTSAWVVILVAGAGTAALSAMLQQYDWHLSVLVVVVALCGAALLAILALAGRVRLPRSLGFMLLVGALLGLMVVASIYHGSSGYYSARRAARDGDRERARGLLAVTWSRRQAQGPRLVVQGLADVKLGRAGVVVIPASSVAMGLGATAESTGETRSALGWYDQALAAYDATGVGIDKTDVESRRAALLSGMPRSSTATSTP